MLTSLLWFLVGSLCGALLLRRAGRPRAPRMLAHPRSRRAWLDRASSLGAALPDPALAERATFDFANESDAPPAIPRERTRQLLAEARRAIRPGFGIRVRVRE